MDHRKVNFIGVTIETSDLLSASLLLDLLLGYEVQELLYVVSAHRSCPERIGPPPNSFISPLFTYIYMYYT